MEETTIMNTEKAYTLRKLKADDVFPFCSIINQIGFKEIKNVMNQDDIMAMVKGKEDIESIGLSIMLDVVGIIISNMEKCKGSLYTLLSNLSGMDQSEIANLDLPVFPEMIFDVFKKDEFKDFMKVVSKLLK